MGPEDSTGLMHQLPDFGGCIMAVEEGYGGGRPRWRETHTHLFWVDGNDSQTVQKEIFFVSYMQLLKL